MFSAPLEILKKALEQRTFSTFDIIQTPLRTAFHDTQRLLLEAYSSNICSDSVLFAPLMKK